MLILLEMYVCYTDVAALFIIFLFFHPFFPVRLIYMVGTRILLHLAGNRTGLPFVFLFFILINLFDVFFFTAVPILSVPGCTSYAWTFLAGKAFHLFFGFSLLVSALFWM
jgi:hypothetical protein